MKPIDDNYITIQGWMVTALNLKGSDLQLFALIHGFCQDRNGRFCGSLTYIENWLNTSRPTCIAAINRLGSAGWITTHVGNINQTNEYSINWKAVDKAREVVKKLYHQAETGSKETLPVVVKNFNGGSKETLPNIYSNTDNDNLESTPAQFIVQTIALETIPTVEGDVPRPAARPTSKVSELQKNINAHSEAAEHFLRLLQAKGHSLNGAEKYAAAYFLNEQRKGRWVSLLIPVGAGAEHQWLGEHGPGIIQWAQRQPQFDRNNGTQPTPPAAPVQIRREI
jgi:hypothetical protein